MHSKKKTLAIVSSYNELCGNATYTHVLQRELGNYYDVTVIPLNTFLLRSESQILRRKAQQHIQEIAEKLKAFDYVNIQLELGLFGIRRSDIRKRLRPFLDNSQNLVVTFHRLDMEVRYFSLAFLRQFISSPTNALRKYATASYYPKVYSWLISKLKTRLRQGKKTSVVVHTKREKRNLKEVFSFEHVFDHPISFLSLEEQESYARKSKENLSYFRKKWRLADNDIVIGIFGFISDYKGHRTAIEALHHLPDNYKLLIFGSQHPHSIIANEESDPYIKSLNEAIFPIKQDKSTSHRRILKNRVQFCGALDDEDFISSLHQVDIAVLPYKETGQSGSGIAALTLESKTPSILSNNLAFFELAKYAPRCFSSFDIGNASELAHRILGITTDDSAIRKELEHYHQQYNIRTNGDIYRAAFEHTQVDKR